MATVKNNAVRRAAAPQNVEVKKSEHKSNEDLMNDDTIGALLDTGNCVLIDLRPSTKTKGTWDYGFAQKRAAIVGADLSGIAELRSAKFNDTILRVWVSSVDPKSHAANIEKGLVVVDKNGDFTPSEQPQFGIFTNEVVGVQPKHIYVDSETEELTFSMSRVKQRRNGDERLFATIEVDGEQRLIFREQTIINIEKNPKYKDTIIAGAEFVDEKTFENLREAELAIAAEFEEAKALLA